MVIDSGLDHIYRLHIVCDLSHRSSWGQSEVSRGNKQLPQRLSCDTTLQMVQFIKKMRANLSEFRRI